MKNFHIAKNKGDSEEKEKMSHVNFLTKEQYEACMEGGKMNRQMAQRLSDKNLMETYR